MEVRSSGLVLSPGQTVNVLMLLFATSVTVSFHGPSPALSVFVVCCEGCLSLLLAVSVFVVCCEICLSLLIAVKPVCLCLLWNLSVFVDCYEACLSLLFAVESVCLC